MTGKSLFINGAWREGSGEIFISEDPFNGDVLWEGRAASQTDIQASCDAAEKAFAGWAGLTMKKRADYIQAFACEVERRKDSLAELISRETGKPLWEALTELTATVSKAKISITAYKERCRQIRGKAGSVKRFTRFKPKGVIAVLGPFNLPLHLPNGHITPALLAGNTVIFKPFWMR